jgi:hypothetical protein
MSTAMFFSTLVQQHNSGEKHLTLHDPICLGFQYGKNVVTRPVRRVTPSENCERIRTSI